MSSDPVGDHSPISMERSDTVGEDGLISMMLSDPFGVDGSQLDGTF